MNEPSAKYRVKEQVVYLSDDDAAETDDHASANHFASNYKAPALVEQLDEFAELKLGVLLRAGR